MEPIENELERIRDEIAKALYRETFEFYLWNKDHGSFADGIVYGLVMAARIIGISQEEIESLMAEAREDGERVREFDEIFP